MRISLPCTAPTVELPAHPRLRDPLTGEPLRALGLTRAGKAIWPVRGGSQPVGEPGPAPTGTPGTGTLPVPSAPAAPPGTPPPSPGPVNPPPNPAAGEAGYPAGVPLEQMTGEQREAYWRHYARRNEDRLKSMADYEQLRAKAQAHDELITANQTEHEKAVTAAREAGRAEAMQQAGAVLVDAHLRAAVGARLQPDQVTALIAGVNTGGFLTADGIGVDTDKVSAFVNAVLPPAAVAPAVAAVPAAPAVPAPALPASVPGVPAAPPASVGLPRQLPDYGQGNPGTTTLTGLAAGRAAAQARFASRQQPRPDTPA
ncbi:hypothetical protein [Actinoplanes sp. NPDC026623]|uniref:hypothetical protein n=1 Tax=Actinoplanes sp. NPDC026623 TaxID=3155610 RepID=UPI0033F18273